MMTGLLVSILQYSNSISLLAIIVTFLFMFGFILRLRSEDMFMPTGPHLRAPVAKPLPIVMVPNPFFLKLKVAECSLTGLSCCLSSQVPCTIQAFWGVSLKELHECLLTKWSEFREQFFDGTLLTSGCLQKGETLVISEGSEQAFTVSPKPKIDVEELGAVPRSRYPLVLIMMRENDLEDTDSPCVGAMVNVIHLQDSICSQESTLIMQYLRQTNSQVSCLQPLYVSKEEVTHPTATADSEENSSVVQDDSVCVVCQTEVVTRALLPCRHACVCAGCFSRIDKCPLCRGLITSYFCIREVLEAPNEPRVNLSELNLRQKVEHYMIRLNSFLGFDH